MKSGGRSAFWFVLATVLGYLAGFLFLLVVGLVIDPLALVALLLVGRTRRLTAETLAGFGLGFTAFVDVRLWGNLFLFRDPGLLFWTLVGIAIGPALILAGLVAGWQRRRRPTAS